MHTRAAGRIYTSNKKAGHLGPAPRPQAYDLDRLDVARLLLALVSLRDFEGNFLTFLERFEARHVDRGEMREEIFAAAVRRDETETFRIVEPLDRASCHLRNVLQEIKRGLSPTDV